MATYTLSSKIRDDAGFNDNEYIADSSIDSQRLRAFGVINSYVGMRYAIPDTSDENFIDSPAATFLESIEIGLGAGYLLIVEYGHEARGTDKDGYRKVSDAMALLADVRDGKIALFGKNGNLLPAVASENKQGGRIRGFPKSNSENVDRKFSISDKF